MRAISLWSHYNRADALAEISRAISLETDGKLLPRHLALRAEIYEALASYEKAQEDYIQAFELIGKHQDYWSKSHNRETASKIKRAIEKDA